jgi:hypothetical protein
MLLFMMLFTCLLMMMLLVLVMRLLVLMMRLLRVHHEDLLGLVVHGDDGLLDHGGPADGRLHGRRMSRRRRRLEKQQTVHA